MSDHESTGFHGPKSWVTAAFLGGLLGCGLVLVAPPAYSGPDPIIPIWLVAPFGLLLACIATMPFIAPHVWHKRYPDVSFLLGSMVAVYYIAGFRMLPPGHSMGYGPEHMLHAAEEFYSFIALVGGLFVVSGGILIDVRARGRPFANTLLLLIGAVLANIVGTTGASMLLIRPFKRMNRGRVSPLHIVFFIFIVSNCGGCLTPVGDPPLYLGYLKGVPFLWTLKNLWYDWAFTVGILLVAFYVADRFFCKKASEPVVTAEGPIVSVRGGVGIVGLALMLVGVFIAPMLKAFANVSPSTGGLIGATFQVIVAITAHVLAPRQILKDNSFNFGPVKEVGLLFAGIFATMVPALGYLAKHGASIGLDSPTVFYFGTGSLSAVLDNAPTYLSFLQIAFGAQEVNPATIATFIATPSGNLHLNAISTGAVFFGAMTYIGNGPNFMVKAMAESAGIKMPSFFGYLGRACLVLLPILIIHWLIFIR